jgi:hypothetical protein
MRAIPLVENLQQNPPRSPKHKEIFNRILEKASGITIDEFCKDFCQKEHSKPKRFSSLCELIRDGLIEVKMVENEPLFFPSNLPNDERSTRRPIVFQLNPTDIPHPLH